MKRFLVVHVALIVLATVAWFPPAVFVDDAFITFRYAENLAAGEGFRYNPTEAILDARPLFTALLAAIVRIGGITAVDAFVILQFLAAVAFAIACVVIFWRRPFGAVAVLVPWIVLSDRHTFETTGMESLCFLATATWALAAATKRWWSAAALLAIATTLIRPDGVFLAAALALTAWIADKRLPRRYLVVAAVGGGLWCAFATFAFGSPLPPTIAAKAAQAKSGIWQELFVETLWNDWLPHGPVWLFILAGVGAAAALIRRDRLGLTLVVWIVLHQGAYAVFNVPAYRWYYVPLVGEAALLAAYGVESLVAAVPRISLRTSRRVAVVAATLVAAVWLGASHERLAGAPDRLKAAALAPPHIYRSMGDWLRDHTEATDRVAAFEVGIVGYYSARPIADFFGLVTENVAPLVPNQQHVDHVMRTYRPAFVVGWDPPTGHDSNLPQYVIRGYDAIERHSGRALYRRRTMTEASLAARVAALAPGQRGRVAFGDFPKMLDFDRFRTALRALRPGVDVVRWPTGREPMAIRLDDNGTVRLVEVRPPLRIGGDAIAGWPRCGFARLRPSDRAGVARFRTRSQFAFIQSPIGPGAGPFRRARLRLKVLESGGRTGAAGRLWWSSSADDGTIKHEWMTFVIPRVGTTEDVIVHFPGDGIPQDVELHSVRIDLLDQPGLVEIEGFWLDRT